MLDIINLFCSQDGTRTHITYFEKVVSYTLEDLAIFIFDVFILIHWIYLWNHILLFLAAWMGLEPTSSGLKNQYPTL